MPSVGIGTNWLGPPVPPPISTSLPTRSGCDSANATALANATRRYVPELQKVAAEMMAALDSAVQKPRPGDTP
jgi:hypothetical protein